MEGGGPARATRGDARVNTPLLTNEPLIRLMVFMVVLLAMAAWELLASRRPQQMLRTKRWPANLLIVVLDTAVVRLVFPLAAVGAAIHAQEQGWGLFNLLSVPDWLPPRPPLAALGAGGCLLHP